MGGATRRWSARAEAERLAREAEALGARPTAAGREAATRRRAATARGALEAARAAESAATVGAPPGGGDGARARPGAGGRGAGGRLARRPGGAARGGGRARARRRSRCPTDAATVKPPNGPMGRRRHVAAGGHRRLGGTGGGAACPARSPAATLRAASRTSLAATPRRAPGRGVGGPRRAADRRGAADLGALADRERAAADERDSIAGELAASTARSRPRGHSSRPCWPTTAPSGRGWRRRSARRLRRASGCGQRTTGRVPPTSRCSRPGSRWTASASRCSSSSRPSARSACGTCEAAATEAMATPLPRRRRIATRRPEEGRGGGAPVEAALEPARPGLDGRGAGRERRRRRAASRRSVAGSTSWAPPTRSRSRSTTLRERLETLDAQDRDLRDAIAVPGR